MVVGDSWTTDVSRVMYCQEIDSEIGQDPLVYAKLKILDFTL